MANGVGAEPFGTALGGKPKETKTNYGAIILDFLARAGGAGTAPEATLGGALEPEVEVDAVAGRAPVVSRAPRMKAPPRPAPKPAVTPTLEQAAAATGRKGTFNVIPAPKTTEIEKPASEKIGAEARTPRFVGGTEAARRGDIVAPKEYTELGNLISRLVEERRRFAPEGSKARARLTQEIADLTAQQRGIRTDIEKGITERTPAKGGAKSVQERIKQIQDQAKTDFERMKFFTQESRLGAESRARIAESYERAATASLGARPTIENNPLAKPEELDALQKQYDIQRKRYLQSLTGETGTSQSSTNKNTGKGQLAVF